MPWMPSGPSEELPSLRASLRLGDRVEGSNISVSFYDVKFYPFTAPGDDPVFALVGANTVWICRPKNDAKSALEVLRCFRDGDITDRDLREREHQLNSVCWTKDDQTGDPLVIVTNDERKIKVLNVKTGKLVRTLIGHGSAINDLVICPTNPNILASCSMDYTIRIWDLSSKFQSQPCVAMCAGEGHREGLLGIAWHRSGRFILSGGHDTVVCLWAIPDLPSEPTDHVVKVFHPHFHSNEVHWNYVDCLQWYGDLILSRAVGESAVSKAPGSKATGSIFLWQIDGFEPDRYPSHSDLPPAPGPPIYKPSFTHSAFGAGMTRLLTFELKFSSLFYMRFALFHQPGQRPVLCAGNERSKVHFWDLQQLEEGPPLPVPSQRWAGHTKRSAPATAGPTSTTAGAEQQQQHSSGHDNAHHSGLVADNDDEPAAALDSEAPDRDGAGFRRPRARKRDTSTSTSTAAATDHANHPMYPHHQQRLNRDESVASDRTGSHVTESASSVVPSELLPPRAGGHGRAGRKSKEDPRLRFAVDDPFRELLPHKAVVVPKVGFCVRQVAWSVGGEWCVACGDNGMVALFSRWMKEP